MLSFKNSIQGSVWVKLQTVPQVRRAEEWFNESRRVVRPDRTSYMRATRNISMLSMRIRNSTTTLYAFDDGEDEDNDEDIGKSGLQYTLSFIAIDLQLQWPLSQ